MTDLEMTRLCAEAMGMLQVTKISGKEYEHIPVDYSPLHDDAQAMALVKKLDLSCSTHASTFWTVTDRFGANTASSKYLNRAIVECVAKMRRAK